MVSKKIWYLLLCSLCIAGNILKANDDSFTQNIKKVRENLFKANDFANNVQFGNTSSAMTFYEGIPATLEAIDGNIEQLITDLKQDGYTETLAQKAFKVLLLIKGDLKAILTMEPFEGLKNHINKAINFIDAAINDLDNDFNKNNEADVD